MNTRPWLLLVHKIPREPSAGRVHVWRKLKQLGALGLQDAVWVLPHTPRTQEQFQWLASEIVELGGEAIVWEAGPLFAPDVQELRDRFTEAVDAEYREILSALKKKDRDLAELSKRFQRAQERDFFASELGRQVRERLIGTNGGKSS